jgi:aspartate carbamoyltransferase catalytic subunit
MEFRGSSLLSTDQLSLDAVQSIFHKAKQIKERWDSPQALRIAPGERAPVVAHMFFEASTRTKTSFMLATHRMGLRPLDVGIGTANSQIKGETEADTFLNIQAMGPDLFVVRHGGDGDLAGAIRESQIPVISAGEGIEAHPTQALLDAFTIQENLGSLQGQKILICGDIAHSRVARSNAELLVRMGAEVGLCGPKLFLPESLVGFRIFQDLKEGLAWSHVLMVLRVQHERHQLGSPSAFALDEYRKLYSIDEKHLRFFSAKGIILHPGPVNWGVELDHAVRGDVRVKIFEQVRNGVFVRAALLALILGIGEE